MAKIKQLKPVTTVMSMTQIDYIDRVKLYSKYSKKQLAELLAMRDIPVIANNSVQYKKAGSLTVCKFCSNNPANNPNASGLCNCSLPEMLV